MDDVYFLKEMHEYIDREFEEFGYYKALVWELFCFFNDICHEENLRYFVAFGSLIGVIRDAGSIPWDYDMDVVMPIDERDRLIAILKERLPSSMYYVYTDNLEDYPTSCLRICKKGYPFTSIHLDVFFAIGCPDNNPLSFVKHVDHIHELRFNKYANKWFPDNSKSKIYRLLSHIRALRGRFVFSRKLIRDEERCNFKYPLEKSKYCCIVSDPYLKYYYTEDFKEFKQMEINGQLINIPTGYDRYLRTIYGDYMTYLPIKKRFTEFHTMTNIVKERQILMDTSDIFDAYK